MVVDDFDLVRMSIPPNEANPPLVVNPDAVLAFAIANEPFEAISGQCSKILSETAEVAWENGTQLFKLRFS